MEVIEGSDALLTEILVRLPLRDVITFKRVDKRWFSLISEPYFSRRRATVQGTRFSGLIVDPDVVNPQHRELTFFYFNKKIRRPCRRRRIFCPKVPDDCSSMLQSCNGLMLLRRFSDTFIYNPTTGDKKRLLSPFPLFDKSPSPEYSLAFDPLRFLGYKLICIFRGKSSKEDGYQTMIYSSESGDWKQCGSSFSAPLDMDLAHGVYFKDSVYWIGNKSKTTLRFDLKTECVKDDMPPLPPAPQDLNIGGSSSLDDLKRPFKLAYNGYGYILAPACGYMNLVGADFDFCMRVFRLKEDDYSSSRSWVLMHSVDLQRTTLKRVLNTDPAGNYNILHLIKDGEDDEMTLFVQIDTKVIALIESLILVLKKGLEENEPVKTKKKGIKVTVWSNSNRFFLNKSFV